MVLVFVHVGALFQQVLFDLFNFDDLLAFPAAGQHWTFFPVVDVESLFIKVWISDSTEVAAGSSFELLLRLMDLLILLLLSLLLLSCP